MSYIKAGAFCSSVSKAIGLDEKGIGITNIKIIAAPQQLVTVEITLLLTPEQRKMLAYRGVRDIDLDAIDLGQLVEVIAPLAGNGVGIAQVGLVHRFHINGVAAGNVGAAPQQLHRALLHSVLPPPWRDAQCCAQPPRF